MIPPGASPADFLCTGCEEKNGSHEFPEKDDGIMSAETELFQEMSNTSILKNQDITKRNLDLQDVTRNSFIANRGPLPQKIRPFFMRNTLPKRENNVLRIVLPNRDLSINRYDPSSKEFKTKNPVIADREKRDIKMVRVDSFVCQSSLHLKKFAAYRRMLTALYRSKIVSESSKKTARDYF